jgi:hypothetical protein
LILDVEVLREVAQMASRRNTIGIRIALKVQGTSVDIILMKMPTPGILFHLFGAHSRILWFQHADEADVEMDGAGLVVGFTADEEDVVL